MTFLCVLYNKFHHCLCFLDIQVKHGMGWLSSYAPLCVNTQKEGDQVQGENRKRKYRKQHHQNEQGNWNSEKQRDEEMLKIGGTGMGLFSSYAPLYVKMQNEGDQVQE